MLRFMQAIAFEISLGCPLAEMHKHQCPINDPHRWDKLDTSAPLSDDAIVECCRLAYREMDFRGWVMCHYYNDPMTDFDRLESILIRLKSEVPEARSKVYTNGEILPDDLKRLDCIAELRVGNYTGRNHIKLLASQRNVKIIDYPSLDTRMKDTPYFHGQRCRRMFDELTIDYYGNGHICSGDWRGEVPIGNVQKDGYAEVVRRYMAVRDMIMHEPMPDSAPLFCRQCGFTSMRTGDCVIDQAIFAEITKYRGF